ncbi:MAG: SDR family NAD(P)-dependent oxidoreductase [Calditrichae bacterium]|nr:SDR family NAD(P)-dependent oxidoreductase [Calditrichia bacterium]
MDNGRCRRSGPVRPPAGDGRPPCRADRCADQQCGLLRYRPRPGIFDGALAEDVRCQRARGFYCAQAFANILIPQQQEGVILNIGSISARMSADGYSAYAASKAALNSLTRSLAVEWAGHGIRVNCLAPAIPTPKVFRKQSPQRN